MDRYMNTLRELAHERLDDVMVRFSHNTPYKEQLEVIQSAMVEIGKEAEHLVDHTMKAFGNCELCYGKGYATTIAFLSGRGEFDMGEGHIEIHQKMPPVRFCTCGRGKQLEHLVSTGSINQE